MSRERGRDWQRVLCLTVPDWPALAVRRARGVPIEQPLGVLLKGRLVSCDDAARAAGVRVGLRMREAQARCPEIELHSDDPELDRLQFEPVVAAVESVVPGVEVPRPGVCLTAVGGAARFYGDERAAASRVLDAVRPLDLATRSGTGIGVADDPFTAGLVASSDPAVVPPGGSATSLASVDVGVLDAPGEERLVALLRRLGVTTLGEFAALPARAVRERFGVEGARAHARAGGTERRALEPRVPPRRFTRVVRVDPPLADVEALLAVSEPVLDDLVSALAASWLACTEVTVTLTTEEGRSDRRTWRHPRWFTSRDLADRVRWQLAEWGEVSDPDHDEVQEYPDGVARIDLDPARVEPAADHDGGLWGGGPGEKVQHVVSGLQSTLGRQAVVTPALVGGRAPARRQSLVAWGEQHDAPPVDRPWPASLPPPAPASVFGSPLPCRLYSRGDGTRPVLVTDRGVLDGPPDLLASGRTGPVAGLDISSWAGPWPVDERWWEGGADGPTARLQVQDAEGVGWLLLQVAGEWYLEARYD